MMFRLRSFLWVLVLMPLCARASDGIREINQASIAAAGGFPALLSSGSYALTGDLVVPDLTTTALRITGDGVTLDLRGHSIRGPNACGAGACSSDSGIGVAALPGVRATRLINGTIERMGGDCVQLGDGSHVEGVVAARCGGDGISIGAFSLVLANRAFSNAGDGIQLGAQCIAAHNSAFANNQAGGAGLAMRFARGGAPNSCDDASCSSGTERWFYLTGGNGVPGNQALQRCAAGFHMASLWEIFEPSSLVYDTSRGLTLGDGAPPTGFPGWVRTGFSPYSTAGDHGRANCEAWSSTGPVISGTTARLRSDWRQTSTTPPVTPPLWPWEISGSLCSLPQAVWCVQD